MPKGLPHSYTIRIYWCDKTFCYHANCVELPSISRQGIDRKSVLDAMDNEIKFVTQNSENAGELPIEPIANKKYRGNIPLRVPPSTHRLLAVSSAEEGISMNSLIRSIIETNIKDTGRDKYSFIRLEYSVNELKIINNRLHNDLSNLLHIIREKDQD